MFLFDDSCDVICQVSVGVGLWIGKKQGVLVMFELVAECERVVAALIAGHMFPSKIILVVAYILAPSKPPHLFLFKFFFWVN